MSTLVKPFVVTAVTGAAVTAMRYLSKNVGNTIMHLERDIHSVEDDQKSDISTINEEYISSDKIIFIPKHHTENAMNNNYILELFESTKQLFYYLRWKANMEAIHGNLKIFKISKTTEILIFNTNLHCKNNNELIYIIGIKNDKAFTTVTKNNRIEQWKMDSYFMTSSDIQTKYNINIQYLPLSTETKLKLDLNKLKSRKNEISMNRYSDLPVIKTNKVKCDKTSKKYQKGVSLSVSKQRLMSEIQKSEIFIPIISFNDNKTKYYIDIVLLININNNCIGIIFSEKSNYFNPIGIAIDCVDMKNKMYLFRPAKTVNEYQWIQNDINSLYIYNDKSVYASVDKSKDEIIARLMKEKELLKIENNNLKNINNYYFQQTLNPNGCIKAHVIHMSNAAKTSLNLFQIPANNNVILLK
eukprot:953472_1